MNISTTTYILKERHHTNYLNLKISIEKRSDLKKKLDDIIKMLLNTICVCCTSIVLNITNNLSFFQNQSYLFFSSKDVKRC